MPTYVIVEVEIHDEARYETYKSLTPTAVVAFEGRFVVRGGETRTLEGDWSPSRIVILEFPSMEKAVAWWHSPEYSGAKAIRHQAASTRMIVAQGVGA